MTAFDTKSRTVAIDFLYLDLEVCTRRRGTGANLETALTAVQAVLEAAGADVRVSKTLVDSEQKARALGFLSSPTLRVNGRDITMEFRESRCESEACACTAGGGGRDRLSRLGLQGQGTYRGTRAHDRRRDPVGGRRSLRRPGAPGTCRHT